MGKELFRSYNLYEEIFHEFNVGIGACMTLNKYIKKEEMIDKIIKLCECLRFVFYLQETSTGFKKISSNKNHVRNHIEIAETYNEFNEKLNMSIKEPINKILYKWIILEDKNEKISKIFLHISHACSDGKWIIYVMKMLSKLIYNNFILPNYLDEIHKDYFQYIQKVDKKKEDKLIEKDNIYFPIKNIKKSNINTNREYVYIDDVNLIKNYCSKKDISLTCLIAAAYLISALEESTNENNLSYYITILVDMRPYLIDSVDMNCSIAISTVDLYEKILKSNSLDNLAKNFTKNLKELLRNGKHILNIESMNNGTENKNNENNDNSRIPFSLELSNLGNLEMDNIEDFDFWQTAHGIDNVLSLMTWSFENKLNITLTYSPKYLSSLLIKRILEKLSKKIQHIIN